ncbi:MAG: DUF1587 domain-containing protein, partial [Acidobacteria bacterium]|nr:DUF1587 domain-containing protein [Acidobacteriota bacterium]
MIRLQVLLLTLLAAFAASARVVSMRRLTEQEYRNSIADIFGKDIEIRGFFEPTIRTAGHQPLDIIALHRIAAHHSVIAEQPHIAAYGGRVFLRL